MNDDTATVELRELGEELNHRGFHNFANRCYEAADLLEQQARTIAELLEQLKRESDRTTYTVTLLDPLFGEGNNKPVEALVRGVVKTIAEQAARLAECERDAGRYRWLRARLPSEVEKWSMTRLAAGLEAGDAEVDAAIDGAKT